MIVVLGLGTAGIYAVRWASGVNRKEDITVVERRAYPTYSPCAIPMAVGGEVNVEDLIHPFPQTRRIKVLLSREVVEINPSAREVVVRDMNTGDTETIGYDKLIYALGASPVVPPVPGAREFLGKGVFTVKTVEDAETILRAVKTAKNAVVVGGGAIGVEMAYYLARRGLKTTLVEMLPHLFPRALDPDMAARVEEHLRAAGVDIRTDTALEEVRGDERVVSVMAGGEEMPADIVIMAVGVKPNTSLLEGHVEMDGGYIKVDERMRTSDPHIYAAGDCVLVSHAITGEPTAIQLATTAARQGAVAGINAAGGDAVYTGALGAFVSAFGGYEVAAVGMRGEDAESAVMGRGRGHTRPEWAGGEEIVMKIVADANGRVLGAQAVGRGAGAVINYVSAVIRCGGTLQDLAFGERTYCPEVSELYDVISAAADVALRRLRPKDYRV